MFSFSVTATGRTLDPQACGNRQKFKFLKDEQEDLLWQHVTGQRYQHATVDLQLKYFIHGAQLEEIDHVAFCMEYVMSHGSVSEQGTDQTRRKYR